MGGAWSRRVGAFVAAGALVLVSAPSSEAAAPGRPCFEHLRCLRVAVPLDRSGALPGTIQLRVRVQPALAGTPSETIVALAGGPGQAGAALLDDFSFALGGKALRSRRLVALDQRGTGGSGRLRCRELEPLPDDEALPPDDEVQRAVAACASQLGPARAHYATADSVKDLEAVRVALGVEQLVLYGTSYGTKVALDYTAAHPEHVSRLILDSVVPPGGVDPFMRTTLGSIPRVMRALCGRRGCPFTRDPGADVAALVERLARGPLRGYRVDGHGRRHPASIVRSDVFSLLLAGDLVLAQRMLMPAAVRGALNGDPALLLRLAAGSGASLDVGGGDSDALYLATTCADGGVPWTAGTPVSDRSVAIAAALSAIPPEQLAPFGADGVRDLGLADLCRSWPEAPVPHPQLSLPDVPALILSGDQDLRTPRADALALAAQLPRARVVTVPRTGHGTLLSSLCAENAVTAFLAGRPFRACRPERSFLPEGSVALPPRSLAALPPLPGMTQRVGRTVAAVGTTFDLFARLLLPELFTTALLNGDEATVLHVGGLRGGSLTLSRRALLLRRYSMVPGVTVSGRIEDLGRTADEESDTTPIDVRIGGRAAAHGRLRIGEHWIVGRLGGHRVRVRTSALDVFAADGREAGAARIAKHARERGKVLPPLPGALRLLLGSE